MWRHDSNGYPYICGYAGHVPNTCDIARRWLVTEIQDGGHYKPEVKITFER